MQTLSEVLPFAALLKLAVLARNPLSLLSHPDSKASVLTWVTRVMDQILALKHAKVRRGALEVLGVQMVRQMGKLKVKER
jgi:hypothetical protein